MCFVNWGPIASYNTKAQCQVAAVTTAAALPGPGGSSRLWCCTSSKYVPVHMAMLTDPFAPGCQVWQGAQHHQTLINMMFAGLAIKVQETLMRAAALTASHACVSSQHRGCRANLSVTGQRVVTRKVGNNLCLLGASGVGPTLSVAIRSRARLLRLNTTVTC
jgi:hypothetical protein